MKEKKYRLTVSMPERVVKAIDKNMMEEGYSKRKKSKWIEEAIDMLLAFVNNDENEKEQEKYSNIVETASQLRNKNKTISIYISPQSHGELNNAVLIIRRYHPGLEGVRSLIVRSSIIQRLYRHDKQNRNI